VQDQDKTKDQLIDELRELRSRVAKSETEVDITERKLAREQLKQSEEKYRLLTENMNDVIWQTTPDMVFTYVSPSVKKQRGYEAHEVLGRPIWDFIAPAWIEPVRRRVAERVKLLLSRREAFEPEPYELQIRKDGKTLWTETVATPVFNHEGQLIAFQGVTRDITERKRAEESLQNTLVQFHTILSSLYAAVLVASEEGRVEFVNQAFCDLFDLDDLPENLLGLSPPAMIQKIKDVYAQPAYAMSRIQAIVAQGDPVKGEEIAMRDGRVYMVDFVPIHIDGKRYGRLWLHQDITQRKRMEEDLRISEERFRTAFHFSPDAIIISRTTDGRLVDVNEGFSLISGYSRDEALQSSTIALKLWVNLQDREKVIAALQEKKSIRDYEFSFRNKSGKILDCLYSGEIILIGDEQHILSVVRDISERKRAEQERENLRAQLLQSQKMETMGTLAAGIAHDFNNMLTVILGYSSMLLADKNEKDPGYEGLQKILKTSQDAADLVQRIRIFGRKAEMNLIPLDLNHQIDEVTKLLSSTLPKMIEMDIHLTKDPVIIKADSSQIAQMVMNLAVNAGEAMPQGGDYLFRPRTSYWTMIIAGYLWE